MADGCWVFFFFKYYYEYQEDLPAVDFIRASKDDGYGSFGMLSIC